MLGEDDGGDAGREGPQSGAELSGPYPPPTLSAHSPRGLPNDGLRNRFGSPPRNGGPPGFSGELNPNELSSSLRTVLAGAVLVKFPFASSGRGRPRFMQVVPLPSLRSAPPPAGGHFGPSTPAGPRGPVTAVLGPSVDLSSLALVWGEPSARGIPESHLALKQVRTSTTCARMPYAGCLSPPLLLSCHLRPACH